MCDDHTPGVKDKKMSGLKQKYQKEVAPQLVKEFDQKNVLAAPRIIKVIVAVGLGEGAQDKGVFKTVSEELAVITGQKPKITRAKQSIAGFRLRAGDPIGLMVSLRGERMYDFLQKLFGIVLPRVRDFRGVSLKSFDGQGNYSLGLREHIVFPEIDYGRVKKIRGLEVTVVTNVGDDKKAKRLLELLGMPFEKKSKRVKE